MKDSYQKLDSQSEVSEVADAIQSYLAEFPQAMDTIEGISEWWLVRSKVRIELDMLKRALEYLVGLGLLEVEGTGENPRYRLSAKSVDPQP